MQKRSESSATRIASFTALITADGRRTWRATARAVWRTSAVSAAARAPVPETSPIITAHSSSTGKTS